MENVCNLSKDRSLSRRTRLSFADAYRVWVTGERLKNRSRLLSLQLRAHVEMGSYLHATVMVVIDLRCVGITSNVKWLLFSRDIKKFARSWLIICIRILKELRFAIYVIVTRIFSWHDSCNSNNGLSLKSHSKNYCNVGSGNARQERTVLKGLIGHSNSSGDQAPWECDEKNPVSCAELSTVPTSLYL